MKIFLISGEAGSGKSIASQYLKNYYEEKRKKCVVTGVSKYIKIIAKEILQWDGLNNTKPRTFLQKCGDDFRKKYGIDVFLKRMIEEFYIYEINDVDYLIINDIRLPYEIRYIKSRYPDAVVMYIKSNNPSKLNKIQKSHITEKALKNFGEFDYVIENYEDKKKLENKITTILKEVDTNEY